MKAKVLKAFHQYEEGKTYEFKQPHFERLLEAGYIEKAKGGRPKKETKEEE